MSLKKHHCECFIPGQKKKTRLENADRTLYLKKIVFVSEKKINRLDFEILSRDHKHQHLTFSFCHFNSWLTIEKPLQPRFNRG